MLTVHHLGVSQSERVVWLCEELELDYELKRYKRDPNALAPPELKALHPLGTAPIITDGQITLAETSAVVEYILTKYGQGRLQVKLDDGEEKYADYLFWLHFANGTLQSSLSTRLYLARAQSSVDDPVVRVSTRKSDHAVKLVDERLERNQWLAGETFTAADVMTVFSLTTMRVGVGYGLEPYPNILRWLKKVGERPAYQRAMEKGEPGFTPVLMAEAPKPL